MSYHALNDLVALSIDEKPLWEGDLLDLNDNAKDAIVYEWLVTHPSWLNDIFPHTCTDKYELALGLTYNSSSRILAAMLIDAAEANADQCDGDAYWSEALGHFEDILHNANFMAEVRERIYGYLEDSLRDRVEQSFTHLLHEDRMARGIH